MTKITSITWLAVIAVAISLSACGDGGGPTPLAEGGWGGPVRLANCSPAEMCELDQWASETDFKVIVSNQNAEVSSSDSNVLEIVSTETTSEVQEPFFCFWDCEARTIEFLSVIIRTNGPGDAELVIDGPAGDQARLPVHVVAVERFQIVDAVSGSVLEAIDSSTYFVRLEAYDLENARLAAQGSWTTEPPDTIPLSVQLFDESSDLLEYSATAFLVHAARVTTTLQVSVGETTLEIPVEL